MSCGALGRKPRAGEVLHITRAASVQFVRPFMFRVIRTLDDMLTYDGWLWIEGYQLAPSGDAVARRSLYVMPAGLVWMRTVDPRPRQAARQSVSRGSVRPSSS
ncbi:hypothetical protein [Micromonospora inyonensis]|uniref:Uncharacterized protein n=1 Tax=Micromonospora inyonensis TaxID=47866 RepID=A0A1C6RIL1_9ACTN|nr:hypothetical protein [Micromonospora inyonensis]SCL16980.1 hypothetical protein GA0074694_1844 [Micromonospora inyonensis]